jgi:hypothetical protein
MAGDTSGASVSSAGDVNGDGLDDLIVSSYQADPSGKLSAGKSYVVFGKANSSAINLSTIADASNPTGGFINNKAPCRVACISNSTQINGTVVGFTKHNIRFTCI